MKNTNKILLVSTTATAILLSGCNFINIGSEEVTVQEKFSTEFSKFVGAESIESVIEFSYNIDEQLLKEKGFTDEEIIQIKDNLKYINYEVKYKGNNEQIELFYTIYVKDDKLKQYIPYDFEIIYDLKNEKVYMNMDYYIESMISGINYIENTKEFKEFEKKLTKDEIEDIITSMTKKLTKIKNNEFVDLEEFYNQKENESDSFEGVIDFEFYQGKKSEKEIESLIKFISKINNDKFIKKDNNSIILNLNEEEFNELNKISEIMPAENLWNTKSISENKENNINYLESLIQHSLYNKISNTSIGYSIKDNNLSSLIFENNLMFDNYSYNKITTYKNLKINEPIDFKYNIEDLKVLSEKELNERIIMIEDAMINPIINASIDKYNESIKENGEKTQTNEKFDWKNWDYWGGY